MRNKRSILNLDEARDLTPAVSPVEAMRRQMAVAAFGAVKESDVISLVEKLRDMAMAGDHKAIKTYLELVGVMGKQAAPAADTAGLKMLASALQDIVDEVRVNRARDNRQRLVNGKADDDD